MSLLVTSIKFVQFNSKSFTPRCHCIAAGAQARYGGSLQSEEVSVEGSSESSLTGLVPNDTLFPAEGAHCTASASVLCGYLTYMTQTS